MLKCPHKIKNKKTIFQIKKNNFKIKLANTKLNIFHLLGREKNVVGKIKREIKRF